MAASDISGAPSRDIRRRDALEPLSEPKPARAEGPFVAYGDTSPLPGEEMKRGAALAS